MTFIERLPRPAPPADPSRPSGALVAVPGREADLREANAALAKLQRLCPSQRDVLFLEVRRALIASGVAMVDRSEDGR